MATVNLTGEPAAKGGKDTDPKSVRKDVKVEQICPDPNRGAAATLRGGHTRVVRTLCR